MTFVPYRGPALPVEAPKKQLAPMFKIPLATMARVDRWIRSYCGTPRVPPTPRVPSTPLGPFRPSPKQLLNGETNGHS